MDSVAQPLVSYDAAWVDLRRQKGKRCSSTVERDSADKCHSALPFAPSPAYIVCAKRHENAFDIC